MLMVALVVPTLGLAALTIGRAVSENQRTVERRLIEEASGLRRALEEELAVSIRTLEAMAGSAALARNDLAGFREEALRHLEAHPAWMDVRLSTPEGQWVMGTQVEAQAGAPGDAVDPGSLREAVERQAPVVGPLRAGWRTDGNYAFPIRVPVARDGPTRYVLSAILTPEGLVEVLSMDAGGRQELRALVSPDHVVVARSRDPEQYVGRPISPEFLAAISGYGEGMFESVTLDSERVYSGVSLGAVSGWRGVVAVPRDVIDRDFRAAMTVLGTLGALLLSLGGIASYFIARWIARDISMVTEAASELASGRSVVMAAPRVDEVRRLAAALDRSAALIRVREQERDQRVSRADAARAEAEAATRAKDEFLAMLGHELRNPLAPVLNALHVARSTGGTLADRERSIVERQVRHMARLVDDLLDVSRLRRGAIELHPEEIDLRTLVNEAVEMTRPLFDESRQHLFVDVPEGLGIVCDAHRMTQVFSNLLTNASKYTEPEGTVKLTAHEAGADVVIVCEDTGIGIPADLLPRVFDPFVQGTRGIDRRQGGLGLGLAVARSLVEQHGGTITAFSDGHGCGSRFVVRLPVRVEGAEDRNPTWEPADPGPMPVRVLVVEDNDDVREMLTLALRLGGVDVRGAASSAAALAIVDEWDPTVAVLDIGLPDIDGFELARRLRAREQSRDIYLIALTGYGGDSYASEARAAGFDAFFVKPVGVDALLDTVARLRRQA